MDVDEVVLVSSDSSVTSSPISSQREVLSEVVSEVISLTSTYTREATGSSNEKLNVSPNKKVYHTLSESDSDDTCNVNIYEHVAHGAVSVEGRKTVQKEGQKKVQRKKKKNIPNEELLKKKEEERKLKEEKRQQLLVQKSLKPGECLKHTTVLLDSSLLQCPFGGKLLSAVQGAESPSRIVSNLVPFTVCWERSVPNSGTIEESQVLLLWHYDELISAIVEGKLCDRIRDIRNILLNKDVVLFIYGLQEYFSKREKVKDSNIPLHPETTTLSGRRKLSRHEVETALAELQLQLNFGYRVINTPEELGLIVTQFTKAVAEHPFKKEKHSREQQLSWYAALDSRDCVRVDKNGNGLLRLWQQQLTQFNLAGIDKAQAIATVYPSPVSLKQAYDKCVSRKEAELLLQNIVVRRTQGQLKSFRRIGPELSKKIYMFLNRTEGDYEL